MKIGTICQRLVYTTRASEDVSHAAKVMREKHVGYLVVVAPDNCGTFTRAVGVLTDRDIVMTVVAKDLDARLVRVGDIMTPNPVTAAESDSMESALRKLRQFGIRRLPVTTSAGELVGVVACDDLLKVLADDAHDMVTAMRTEHQIEASTRL